MPGNVPPQTIAQCMTKQDPVPKNQASGGQACKIKDMTRTGSTVTWTMECDQGGQQMESKGQMTYKGDSFEGIVKTIMGPQAGNMIITTIITGNRAGDCEYKKISALISVYYPG